MLLKRQKNWLIIIAMFIFVCYKVFNHQVPSLYTWDLFGSYIYLPMIFDKGTILFNDLTYIESLNNEYKLSSTLYQFVVNENGYIMTKYTMGWSLLMSPFYLIAETWASFGGYKTDGFSFPYKFMLVIGNLFYLLLTLIKLNKVLNRFFSKRFSMILLLIMFFGTNLLFTQTASLGSTHLIELLLITLFLNQTFVFYENINSKNGIYLGAILALICLVRPPDVIFGLIPVLWKNEQFNNLKIKFNYLLKQKRNVIISFSLSFLLLISLQLIYWKLTSGKFIINSYANNPGEGFDWFTPYFQEILFSFRKGWFLYTPLAFISIFGFYSWYKKDKNAISFFIPFLLFFYVVSCWTTWWYADSFSQRALIETYPILIISLGYLILSAKNFFQKTSLYILIGTCILFNLFQTFQMENGILKTDRMTKDYYFSVFGQINSPTNEQESLLSIERNIDSLSHQEIETKFKLKQTITHVFQKNTILNKHIVFSPLIEYSQIELSSKPYFIVKSTWTYEGHHGSLNGKVFSATAMYKGEAYAWKGFEFPQKELIIDTLKKEISYYYLSPHFRTKNDCIRIGVWFVAGDELKIIKLKTEILEPKKIHL